MNYTKAQAFSWNLFPQFFTPEFIITGLKCKHEDEKLDDCSYEIFYDSSASNIVGVVCQNGSVSSNSSNIFMIGGLPLVINLQVHSLLKIL